MTPKEKAIELVDKYLCIDELYNVDLFCDECGMSNDAAKYCALVAVDEIINSNPHSNPMNTYGFSTMAYWKEVKQEIEKL